jgi:hypothetical protein
VYPTKKVNRSTPSQQPSLTNLLSRNLPLPKYFSSQASSAQYHLPRKNPHAISSATLHGRNDFDPAGDDLAEKFVVGWISVEAEISPTGVDKEGGKEARVDKRTSSGSLGGRGAGMGTREERRSFGSDAPSTRTATPTMLHANIGRETPTYSRRTSKAHLRTASGASGDKGRIRLETPSMNTVRKTVEKQLVVITYSGDWYRLRIPDNDSENKEEKGGVAGKKGKCELLEYKRLGVGGGGW